jgi:N-hydroxyarylamine O-acetyltransferase
MGDALKPSFDTDVDLEAYLERVGYEGELLPTRSTLEELHFAHAMHIPFENLDILLGRPIRLDLESLQTKLVWGKRGGYCFEQNLLFGAVLERLGFSVSRLAARVRMGAATVRPRTHMLLKVDLDGQNWLADVGFGGGKPIRPVLLKSGEITTQGHSTLRIVNENDLWILQLLTDGSWLHLYAFTLEPQHFVDYELANYYISTHPLSPFVQSLVAQRPTEAATHVLRNRELTTIRGGETNVRAIADDDELLAVLSETFGLTFAPGTRFRSPIS